MDYIGERVLNSREAIHRVATMKALERRAISRGKRDERRAQLPKMSENQCGYGIFSYNTLIPFIVIVTHSRTHQSFSAE